MSHGNEETTSYVKKHLQKSGQAANLQLNDKVKEAKAKGLDIYHFAFGQSPFSIPKCFTENLQKYAHVHDYLPVSGTKELCKAITDFHLRFQNVEYSVDNYVVGCGSKELIFLAMMVFNGDVVLVSPGWTTYAPQVNLTGRQSFIIKTDAATNWKLTPNLLASFFQDNQNIDPEFLTRNKLLIFNNPGNPSGSVYSKEELESLSDAFERYKIVVLSDEIYGQLTFAGNHQPLSKFYPLRTITTSGFSKWSSAGGWRIGYMVIPDELKELRDAIRASGTHTFTCAPAPMQHAIATALKSHADLDRYMNLCCFILKNVGQYFVRELTRVGVKCTPSEAGYYILPDFDVCRESLNKKGVFTGREMCHMILEEKSVALLPGSDFLRDESELTVRLCFVDFDGDVPINHYLNDNVTVPTSMSVDENAAFIEKFMPRIKEGVKRLVEFVDENK